MTRNAVHRDAGLRRRVRADDERRSTRRALLITLGAGALAPRATFAQQPAKIRRIGRLMPSTPSASLSTDDGFRQGLRDLGWVEGQNISIESRYAEGKAERFRELAAELVRLKVDVIVTASTPATLAAKNATSIVPIVMVTTGDPVRTGLVASLARPGGNVTGLSVLTQELGGKQLELLREAAPAVSRAALLFNAADPSEALTLKQIQGVARTLGVTLQAVDVRTVGDLDSAFAAMRKERAGALLVLPDPTFFTHRERIVALAAKNRLPVIYGMSEFVDAGGLMFYGATLSNQHQHAATFVDKILKGAKPADLPVEQPTKFELLDRKSTRLNSSHIQKSRMPSSA